MFGENISGKQYAIYKTKIKIVQPVCRNRVRWCFTSASGPFCPLIKSIYGFNFFNELKTRFGAQGGDFATAYVIAHEMGHHVQTLLGTSIK
jgi:predicted metalloprotease